MNHPCKQTCSGWQQGYDRGHVEGMRDAARLSLECQNWPEFCAKMEAKLLGEQEKETPLEKAERAYELQQAFSKANLRIKEVLAADTVTYQKPGSDCPECHSWPCDCAPSSRPPMNPERVAMPFKEDDDSGKNNS